MSMRKKILFICVHNSARSQMAAALVNQICRDEFFAESAGLEPGRLNPFVVAVLAEDGIDISKNKTQAVFDVWKSGRLFDYVVTVCSEAESEGCPISPGPVSGSTGPSMILRNSAARRRINAQKRAGCATRSERRSHPFAAPSPKERFQQQPPPSQQLLALVVRL